MVLELNGIKLQFPGRSNCSINLLGGVDLSIKEGEILALIGGNGSGKTTLFNIISGYQKDFSGEVIFKGKDISKLSSDSIARLGIGRLFQNGQLVRGLSLLDNFKLASRNTVGETPIANLFIPRLMAEAEKSKKELAESILVSLFGSETKYLNMLDVEASNFSYGEQRLLSIARLMMSDASLLLLDEPTSGVNVKYFGPIKSVIQNLVKKCGCTVFVIEHNMQFVSDLADSCAFLDEGVVKMQGSTSDVLSNKRVRSSYLGV